MQVVGLRRTFSEVSLISRTLWRFLLISRVAGWDHGPGQVLAVCSGSDGSLYSYWSTAGAVTVNAISLCQSMVCVRQMCPSVSHCSQCVGRSVAGGSSG